MKRSKEDVKWDRAWAAMRRVAAVLSQAGILLPVAADASGVASVTCSDAPEAKKIAFLVGGKVDRGGNGYAAHTVVAK